MGMKVKVKVKIKVKAKPRFSQYRNLVLGLPLKKFRALQAGEAVEIPINLYKKYPIFQEVKDGD